MTRWITRNPFTAACSCAMLEARRSCSRATPSIPRAANTPIAAVMWTKRMSGRGMWGSSRKRLLGEAELLGLQRGVQEGRDDDEPVAIPLCGLAEFHVECFPCGGDHLAVGEDHLPAERPRGAGDHGDPVATSELDRVQIGRASCRERV